MTSTQLDPNFKYEVAAQPGGENLFACFACGSCSAGCPVREIDQRYNPRRILRMALLGLRERVLSSEFIWLCSTCYTCQERCPQGVRIADLMMALRNLAARSGHLPAPYQLQMDLIRANGRLYEIDEFDNKRRLKMGLPEIPMKSDEVRAIFEMAEGCVAVAAPFTGALSPGGAPVKGAATTTTAGGAPVKGAATTAGGAPVKGAATTAGGAPVKDAATTAGGAPVKGAPTEGVAR